MAADPVGFVGAGSMGGPMVERLLAAGVPVHLYARRPEVAARFAELGATIEPSVAAVAAAARLVILCPFSAEQLATITEGPDGVLAHARPGTVVVQHATVPLTAIRRLAAAATDAQVAVLDAPISGTADQIRAGRLTVLVAGDPAAVDRAGPTLATYAATVVHTGEIGSATTVKLVNNLMFAAHVQTALAAVRLGQELGVGSEQLLTALSCCSADSIALRHLQAAGGVEGFTERVVPYLRKDVAAVEQAAADAGVSTGTLGEVVRSGPAPLTDGTPTGGARSSLHV